MKLPWWALPLVALVVFVGGVVALREAGVWRGRERALPPAEQVNPRTPEPGPGAMPM